MLNNKSDCNCRCCCKVPCECCTKPGPAPKSSNFMYKVLYSLVVLHDDPCFRNGANVKKIVSFIKAAYNNDGDVLRQVETALKHCLKLGYVHKPDTQLYKLIVNSGSIQKAAEGSAKRQHSICRISSIFTKELTKPKPKPKPNDRNKTNPSCKQRNSKSCNKRNSKCSKAKSKRSSFSSKRSSKRSRPRDVSNNDPCSSDESMCSDLSRISFDVCQSSQFKNFKGSKNVLPSKRKKN